MQGEALASASFRIMTADDVPAVLDIEKRSFPNPWSAERFTGLLSGPAGATCVVLESGGKIVSYFVVELRAESTHILNLAVHPDHRRHGHALRCLAFIQKLARRALDIASGRDPSRSLAATRAVEREEGESGGVARGRWGRRKVAQALDEHAGTIHLEVGESNLAAQLLYRKAGYRATRILRNHYPGLEEDAYEMVRKIHAGA
jgi:ribosomal protein S18 acetylase RimI-like enzyme